MLDFVTALGSRHSPPHVLSLSLGSLSFASCALLCDKVAEQHPLISRAQCASYLQTQRQVCMFDSAAQVVRVCGAA